MNLRHVVVLCKLIYTYNSLLTNVIQHIGIRIRNILQICQNMYAFGEISLTCLTKYAFFFFLIGKIMTDNEAKCTMLGE